MFKRTLLTNIDSITGTTSVTGFGKVLNVADAEGYSLQVDFTGGTGGFSASIIVQGSNNQIGWGDHAQAVAITGTSGTVLIGVPDDEHDYLYTRPKVVTSAGSAVITITTNIRSRQA